MMGGRDSPSFLMLNNLSPIIPQDDETALESVAVLVSEP